MPLKCRRNITEIKLFIFVNFCLVGKERTFIKFGLANFLDSQFYKSNLKCVYVIGEREGKKKEKER